MQKLYELKEKLCKELEGYASEPISASTLKDIDMLVHATKNICKIIEKCEEEEYAEAYAMANGGSYRGSYRGGSYAQGGGSYRGSYDEGSMESRWVDPMEPRTYEQQSSYARGRGRGARRDSMGRYSRDDGKHKKVVDELKELQRMSNNELDKEKYDSLIHLVESM